MTEIKYRFGEDKYIAEAKKWIDDTYQGYHYISEADGAREEKTQATDFIIDSGHGTGFNIGNIMKLARRYGKKEGYNRKDLLKIIHYAIIQLYVQDVMKLNKGDRNAVATETSPT